MHDTKSLTRRRLERFVAERLVPAVYRERTPLDITAWTVPDEPVPFAEAVSQAYEPFTVGTPWGKPWGTVWFHITGAVPAEWAAIPGTRAEVVVDLGFSGAGPGFQAEGLAWSPKGSIVKAIEPRNSFVPVDQAPGAPVDLYIEAASNPDVQNGAWINPSPLGDKATAGPDPIYTLRTMDIALLDVAAWELLQDVTTLSGLYDVLPTDSPRAANILAALEDMMDIMDPDDIAGSLADGREALAGVLSSPANASSHVVHAAGHAHIDSAWLWPTRETIRKCARTFSNVLELMDTDPDVKFVCSSAQQWYWIKERYPELFERIRERVADGRFLPVGGMWVESDTNMVGSEAMARQMIMGKLFFLKEFGYETKEVWLPDSFGYTASLPQIAKLAGAENFLTQKISWNDTNTMPHHTFWWEGIDGSRVFTHFPPVDTYNSDLSGPELARAERQFADKGRANTSLAPFGWGDGGGGPTREMVAAAHRAENLEGSPKVVLSGSDEFFEAARAEYKNPPTWVGEMYLEFHRGTYTSQGRTKRGNRRSEHLLHEAELWAATATVRAGVPYPAEELAAAWRTVLLQQFHDILPGSSIAWVHREAERNYEKVAADLEALIASSLKALAGSGDTDLIANASPFGRLGANAMALAPLAPAAAASLERDGENWVLANEHVRVVVDDRGLVVSAIDTATGREAIAPGRVANLLQFHSDVPNNWEAWDIDRHYRHSGRDLVEADAVERVETEHGPGLRVVRSFSGSKVEQILELPGDSQALRITTHVDWHEQQKLLKLAFPVAVSADKASSEMQFGHVTRPIHENTSWDQARFETVAHRWVHVGEHGYGVAVVNDSTYGHDITRMRLDEDGGAGQVGTTIRLTLVRAPRFPDPVADQGEHTYRCEFLIGASIDDAVRRGYALNLRDRVVRGGQSVEPLVSVDEPAVVVETVKLAEDGSGDVVVRLYESLGGRARAVLSPAFEYSSVEVTDLLERTVGDAERAGDGVRVALAPFQILTLRFHR